MRGADRQAAYLAGIVLFLFASLHSAGQTQKATAPLPFDLANWSCATEYLIHGGRSDPLAYRDSEQILKSVASFRALQIPCCYSKLNIAGEVRIEVVIDRDGRLQCARAVAGNPLAMQSAIQSLPAWRFRPYRMRGRRATVIGFIALPFHFLSE